MEIPVFKKWFSVTGDYYIASALCNMIRFPISKHFTEFFKVRMKHPYQMYQIMKQV